MNDVAVRIKKVRESIEITQAELAARVGMLPAQLSRIETGRTDPSIGTASRIAAALGMTLGELLSGARESAAAKEEESADAEKFKESNRNQRIVREIMSSAEKAIRKAISSREETYDAIDAKCGAHGGTILQLAYRFVREPGGMETLSRVMRASLGSGETTIDDLPGLLDLHGVRVHVVKFRGEEPSAAFYDVERGVLSVAVRKGDTPERQTYRIAYELGAACLFASDGFRSVRDRDENHRLMQRFAAAFLMPEDGVRKVVAQCGLGRKDWTMQALLALKVRFNVSAEAFALRLEELGLIVPSLRKRLRDELRAYYAAHPKNMEPEPRLPPLRESVRMEIGSCGVNINDRCVK